MRDKLLIILAYLALLTLALPIPLLHYWQTDKAIEVMRPVIKHADGVSSAMLLPAQTLILRWLGQVSCVIPVILLVMFLLSFWRESFARLTTICALALCQCAFTTMYALYATVLLGTEWLQKQG